MFYSEHLLKFLLLICIYYISKLYFKDLCFGPSASFQFTVNLHCFSPRTILYLHLKSYILFALLPNYWPPGRYLNPGELFLSFFHLKTECFSSFFPSLSVWYKSRFLNNWPICFVFIFILFYNQFQNRTKKKKKYNLDTAARFAPLSIHQPSLFTRSLLTKMMVMTVMKQDAIVSLDVFFTVWRLAPGLFVTNKTKLTFQKHLSHY